MHRCVRASDQIGRYCFIGWSAEAPYARDAPLPAAVRKAGP
jgi:hypothetical protein